MMERTEALTRIHTALERTPRVPVRIAVYENSTHTALKLNEGMRGREGGEGREDRGERGERERGREGEGEG